VSERFPEDKGALGFAAVALVFAVSGGRVPAGGAGVSIGENNKTGRDDEGAE